MAGRPDTGPKVQSSLMLAALATACHLASCAATNFAKSSGVPGEDAAPSFVIVSRTSARESPSFIVSLIALMISGGVPTGAMMPLKVVTS